MPLSNSIRVKFETVDVRQLSPRWGPSEWSFRATVGGEDVGDTDTRFPAELRSEIALPEDDWTEEVDMSEMDRLEINFSATAIAESGNHNLGSVRWVLRWNRREFGERERTLTNRFFGVTIKIEVSIGGSYSDHPDNAIYASREVGDQTIWTTASGRRMIARLEFCEVRPQGSWAPARPRQPHGAGPPRFNQAGRPRIQPTDPINFIHNPSVIPMLSAADANDRTAACIEWTYYRPQALDFTDNDTRLRWSSRTLAGGGSVAFVGGNQGLIVYVRGTHEGEVLLECSMEGIVLASYRALVRNLRNIPFRCNILNGPVGSRPRSTPQNVQNHIAIANIILRQVGLQLTPDTNNTVTHGAVAVAGFPGIFRISTTPGRTVNVSGNYPLCSRLNYRANVLNIAYIHSDNGGFLGMATDFSGNSLPGTRVEDSGTPSTSWISPNGIPPEGAAQTVRMRVFRGNQRRAGDPQLFGLYVTSTGNGSPTSEIGSLTYAGTIAHELGHILTLRHRIGAGSDGLNRPNGTNLMHHNNPSTRAQDIDIIQARAVLGCPLVQPAAAPAAPAAAPAAAGAGP